MLRIPHNHQVLRYVASSPRLLVHVHGPVSGGKETARVLPLSVPIYTTEQLLSMLLAQRENKKGIGGRNRRRDRGIGALTP